MAAKPFRATESRNYPGPSPLSAMPGESGSLARRNPRRDWEGLQIHGSETHLAGGSPLTPLYGHPPGRRAAGKSSSLDTAPPARTARVYRGIGHRRGLPPITSTGVSRRSHRREFVDHAGFAAFDWNARGHMAFQEQRHPAVVHHLAGSQTATGVPGPAQLRVHLLRRHRSRGEVMEHRVIGDHDQYPIA